MFQFKTHNHSPQHATKFKKANSESTTGVAPGPSWTMQNSILFSLAKGVTIGLLVVDVGHWLKSASESFILVLSRIKLSILEAQLYSYHGLDGATQTNKTLSTY
jgi:hypothetical protein